MGDIVIYDGYGDGVVDGDAWDVPTPAALPGPVDVVSQWEYFDPCQPVQGRVARSVVDDGADYNRFEGVAGMIYGGALLFMGSLVVGVLVVLIDLLLGGV